MKTSERLSEFCAGDTSLFYASEDIALDDAGVCEHEVPKLLTLVAAQHEAIIKSVELLRPFQDAGVSLGLGADALKKHDEAIAAHEKWEAGE